MYDSSEVLSKIFAIEMYYPLHLTDIIRLIPQHLKLCRIWIGFIVIRLLIAFQEHRILSTTAYFPTLLNYY